MEETTLEYDAGDELRLHVSVVGQGPPLALLHGFTGSGLTWAPLVAALKCHCTMIRVDLPGHGRSTKPADPARYALHRFADDLAGVLDALAIPRAAVLGYSLGGRAALHFALAHPERVTVLILESVSPGIAGAGERAQRVAADATLADAIERDGVPAFVAQWERLPLWISQESTPQATRAALHTQRLANDARGLANSLRGAGAGSADDVTPRLTTLHIPVLLVAGALDAKYVALGQLMAGSLPGARLAVVPNAGHAVHVERPDDFAALVLEAVRTMPRVAAAAR